MDYSFENNIYRSDMTILLIRKNNRWEKYTKAFTLIELLIGISIIAILVVPAYSGYI
ncbi:prepilin-type N-terminal cleavage/methylation domain-containing protein [Clostridium tagluense]|uniref:prepilin-type N-terminal cleavage/methylation domain-containing protein n=1 Tax=Clostridium tagluense TaxID=360422 RepID=UPI001CF427B5|nr:prepilin-type N-terminal cleavage/methylation domain-containing protein [Clostridium tagluense]MCB2296770.1 prepilin-type N-terminal cleavage/methylation domain-containing protein [Clostridium tagluense]